MHHKTRSCRNFFLWWQTQSMVGIIWLARRIFSSAMCTIPPCTTKGLHCDANTHIGPIALWRVGAPSPLCSAPPGLHRPCKKGGVSGATSKAGSSHVSLSDLVEQMLVSRHVDTAKVSQHNQVQKETGQRQINQDAPTPSPHQTD